MAGHQGPRLSPRRLCCKQKDSRRLLLGFSLQVPFLPEIFPRPWVKRDTEWRRLRVPAEFPHVQASVINGKGVSSGVDRFANSIGHFIAQPSMGDDRPAAEIQCPDILF